MIASRRGDAALPRAAGVHSDPSVAASSRSGLPRGVRGAADSRFANVSGCSPGCFPGDGSAAGRFRVYIDGRPVVDVWTGWSDRAGEEPWTADTGAMVFSATKGVASTVIHRLVDRGLLSYDEPVASTGRSSAPTARTTSPSATSCGIDPGCRTSRVSAGRFAGSPPHGGATGRRAGRPPARRAGLSRADLRMAAVRSGPGGDGHGHAGADPQRAGVVRSTRTGCISAARRPMRRPRSRRSWPRRAPGPIRCSTSSRPGWPVCRSRAPSVRCTSLASNPLCRAISRFSTARCPPPTA